MQNSKIESGAELFSRVNSKCSLDGINPYFFPEGGPQANQILEITGEPNIDKRDLLIDFMVKCILPEKYNKEWKGSGVVLINTEFQINLFKIIKVMETYLKEYNIQVSRKTIIENSLKNLTIFNCYSLEDLEMTLYSLERFIYSNENVNLVIIDNIAANYWIAKLDNNSLSYFQHSIRLLEIAQNVLKHLNVVLIFVRHERNNKKIQGVDYSIEMKHEGDNKFSALIKNFLRDDKISVSFRIETILKYHV